MENCKSVIFAILGKACHLCNKVFGVKCQGFTSYALYMRLSLTGVFMKFDKEAEYGKLPDDLKSCIAFHGHLCPGLIYGYIVSKKAMGLLGIKRAGDEEIVAICETDSCSVDALQVYLGTTAGKGNLIIRNYGKNVFTVFSRTGERAFRFSRDKHYCYKGDHAEEFSALEEAVASGTADKDEIMRQKFLKAVDLAGRSAEEVFTITEADLPSMPYAMIASSVKCEICGEMTMETRMKINGDGRRICIPCVEKEI